MESSQFSEAVYLFVDGQVAAELRYEDFLGHIERQTEIQGAPPAACVSRACYVQVDTELRIAGLVFFLLQIDDQGRVDRQFNVPLPYLAKNAGPGPDFGYGPVPMACRGSCSVPWHANNLWDPTQIAVANPLAALTSAVTANRLEFHCRRPAVLPPEVLQAPELFAPAADPIALIGELAARHTQQLIDLQAQHETELESLQATTKTQCALYQREIARLRERVKELQPAISVSQSVGSRLD